MGRPHPRLLIPWLRAICVFLNTNLFVIGGAATIVSFAIEHDLHQFTSTLNTESFVLSPHVPIFMGLYIMNLTAWGYVCLFRMVPRMIYLYTVFLVVLFFMELGTVAAMICYWKVWPQVLEDGLTLIINNYDPQSLHLGVYLMHYTFDCCGVHNYTDWQRADRAIPMSCCTNRHGCIVSDHNNLFQTGCYDAITEGLDRHWCTITTYGLFMIVYTLLTAKIAWLLSFYLVVANRVPAKQHSPVVVHVRHLNTCLDTNELI